MGTILPTNGRTEKVKKSLLLTYDVASRLAHLAVDLRMRESHLAERLIIEGLDRIEEKTPGPRAAG
jgi:hypothetical protein